MCVSFQEFDSGMPSMGSHYAELRIPESTVGFFGIGFGSEAAACVRVLRDARRYVTSCDVMR